MATRQLAYVSSAFRLLQLHHDIKHRLWKHHDHGPVIEYAGLARSDVRTVLPSGGGSDHRRDQSGAGARVAARRRLAVRVARTLRCALAVGVALVVLSGCATIRKVFHMDDKSTEAAEQLQIQQQKVMRFADEYVGRIAVPIRTFQASTDNAED